MTNGDKIRAMTDEELKVFISSIVYYCRGRQDNRKCSDCPLLKCGACNNQCIGEWLHREVAADDK